MRLFLASVCARRHPKTRFCSACSCSCMRSPFRRRWGASGTSCFREKPSNRSSTALTLVARMKDGSLSSKDFQQYAKRPLPREVKSFIGKAVKLKALAPRKEAVEDWQRFHDSAPCLTGRDVRDLGYSPGRSTPGFLTPSARRAGRGSCAPAKKKSASCRTLFR